MKQWFPDMGATTIDQRNPRLLAAAHAISELSRQFKPSGSATYDNDVAQGIIHLVRDFGVGSHTGTRLVSTLSEFGKISNIKASHRKNL
jgi:hypothetical protein